MSIIWLLISLVNVLLFQILKFRIWPERKPGEPESMFTALMESFLYNDQLRPSIVQLLDSFRKFQQELTDTSSETGTYVEAHQQECAKLTVRTRDH